MKITSNGASMHIRRPETLLIQDGLGYRIVGHSGTVWITLERDSRDIVLKGRDSFVIDRSGLTIVQALDAATITLEEPTEQEAAATSGGWFARAVNAIFA